MKKLFVFIVLMVFSVHHAFSLDLNITLANAGDLINQVDMSKLDEVESLTIAGDLNGTDILVIRKMVNLKTLDMENANIVNGGSSYYEDYITSENEIGAYFFKDKAQLERIILPTTLKVVCGYAFDESRIRTITIPKSVTVIADNAFCNCDSLSEVILEDGDELLYIGDNNYRKLTTLYLGRNLSYKIGGSFSLIETLEHLTIGAKVTQIMPSTFENCHNLKDFVFPNTIEEIGELAFRACSSIQTVSIPKSTKNIGAGAFADCSNLTSFIIEDSNEALEITSAYVMPTTTKILQLTALSDSPIRTLYLGRNLEFPNSFYSAFFQMDSLSVVNIGNCVTNINGSLFLNCRNLETVNLTDNVISIGGSSFSGCSSLKFIDIPNSTTAIGSRAFKGCSSLTTITIPLEVERIEELTFYGCYSLESVSIPNSVKSIGSSSFNSCI